LDNYTKFLVWRDRLPPELGLWGSQCTKWDGAHFVTTRKAATAAYEEAGIKNPREEIRMMEVHDCFSIMELVTNDSSPQDP